jgi:hypothetical protein
LTVSELEAVIDCLDKMELERREVEQLNAWLRIGRICAVLTNGNPFLDKKDHPKPFQPYEFIPQSLLELIDGAPEEQPEPKQTWQEMKAKLETMTIALGGKVLAPQKERG